MSQNLFRIVAKVTRKTRANKIGLVKKVGQRLASRYKLVKTEAGVFSLPSGDLSLLMDGTYEPLTLAEAQKIIKPGDTVLDIGANTGWHTVNFSRMVGESGRIYAYEPEPEMFQYLLKNISQNDCQNVSPIEAAVSDHNGVAELFIGQTRGGLICMSATGTNSPVNESTTIKTLKLDDCFPLGTKISLAKIDVEGWEPQVLKGMERIIAENDIAIIIEFTGSHLKKIGADMGAYKKLLSKFDMTALDELDQKRIYPITLDELFSTDKQLNILLKK